IPVDSVTTQWHIDLLRCDLRPILTALSTSPPAGRLENYLHETDLTRNRSYGFTLGVAKWQILGGQSQDRFTAVTRQRGLGSQAALSVAYEGLRGYNGSTYFGSDEWSADFRADMGGFAVGPTLADLCYGFHALYAHDQKSMSDSELRS